uniref:Uncharacterized protein n=1 Tax=Hyaloperonospora arabidopsidis (strain Emoy2) TaxID=559515 RepID=M4BML8_HYAAE
MGVSNNGVQDEHSVVWMHTAGLPSFRLRSSSSSFPEASLACPFCTFKNVAGRCYL